MVSNNIITPIRMITLGAGALFLIAFLYTLPVYFLWNWLMPIIFNLPKITLWESLGLTLLTGLLFRQTSGKK